MSDEKRDEKKQADELQQRVEAIEEKLGLRRKQPTQDEILRSRKRS